MVRKVMTVIVLTAAVLSVFVPVARAASAEEVEAQILEAWGKLKSLTATISLEAELDAETKMASTGDYAMLAEGDTVKYEQNMKMTVTGPSSIEMSMHVVFDGKDLYVVNEAMGEKTAIKTTPGTGEDFPPPGGKLLFDMLKQEGTLKALDPAEADGVKCLVLECAPKEDNGVDRMLLFFDQETGVARRMELHAEGQEKPVIIRYTNIELNPKLDPARFIFKAPDGVEVIDGTVAPAPPEVTVEPPEDVAPPADSDTGAASGGDGTRLRLRGDSALGDSSEGEAGSGSY